MVDMEAEQPIHPPQLGYHSQYQPEMAMDQDMPDRMQRSILHGVINILPGSG